MRFRLRLPGKSDGLLIELSSSKHPEEPTASQATASSLELTALTSEISRAGEAHDHKESFIWTVLVFYTTVQLTVAHFGSRTALAICGHSVLPDYTVELVLTIGLLTGYFFSSQFKRRKRYHDEVLLLREHVSRLLTANGANDVAESTPSTGDNIKKDRNFLIVSFILITLVSLIWSWRA